MSLIKYIAKKLLGTIPTMFIVLFITFILTRLMSGSPFLPQEGQRIDWEYIDSQNYKFGLNEPLITQFIIYIKNIFTGNWGESLIISQGTSVWDLIATRFPVTLELALFSTFFSILFGIYFGVVSAKNKNNFKDNITRIFSFIGVAFPVFWIGLIIQYIFCYKLGWFEVGGYFSNYYIEGPPFITGSGLIDSLITKNFALFVNIIWHLVLPVFCLTFITIASISRQTRSSMIEVLEEDYIRTARAKGCKDDIIIYKHALRNSLLPTITIIGMNFASILAGTILIERTFNLHGFGMLMIEAIVRRDYFVVNALVFITTLLFIIINLITDITYSIIDPRIIVNGGRSKK